MAPDSFPQILAVDVPISWVLGIVGSLAGTVTLLAGIIYKSLEKRIGSQNRIIEAQSRSIGNLQADVRRLVSGCGAENCHWHSRPPEYTKIPSLADPQG